MSEGEGAAADAASAEPAATGELQVETKKEEKPPPAWMAEGTKPWDVTLFGCWSGPDAGNAICVVAYCPGCCCLTGEAATHAKFGGWYPCCIAQCFAPCIAQPLLRSKAVKIYRLQEPSWKAYLIGLCCPLCSTCQVNGQIMIEEQKQFSDIIASTKLVERPAGLAATKKLRASFLEDPRKAKEKWDKIDKLQAPMHKMMDREFRVDAQDSVVHSVVAKMIAEMVYEGWMNHELDRHAASLLDAVIEEEISETGDALVHEWRKEGYATLLATTTDDIAKAGKKMERAETLMKESAGKEQIARKKFEQIQKEIKDEETADEEGLKKYQDDIDNASSEATRAGAQIALGKLQDKLQPNKEERAKRLEDATAEYNKIKEQADSDAKDYESAKSIADAGESLKATREEMNKQVQEEEATYASGEADAKAARKAEVAEARKAREDQAKAAGDVWKVDLDEVAKKAHELSPPEKRENVMEGLEGVQASLDANREALSSAKGGKSPKKKKKSKASAGAPMMLDPSDVPDEFTKQISMPDFSDKL